MFIAALLYLGAACGMSVLYACRPGQTSQEASLGRGDIGYAAGMIVLDIAAPVLLMWGLVYSTPATVSLLNNFEIVATALLACWVFKESVGKHIWAALGIITAASAVLSVQSWTDFSFSRGALLAWPPVYAGGWRTTAPVCFRLKIHCKLCGLKAWVPVWGPWPWRQATGKWYGLPKPYWPLWSWGLFLTAAACIFIFWPSGIWVPRGLVLIMPGQLL